MQVKYLGRLIPTTPHINEKQHTIETNKKKGVTDASLIRRSE